MTQRTKDYLGVIVLSTLLFVPFLGGVHLFDWDEINFAECAREMLETGNYLQVQMDYQAFWEKPPLFFWLQALSMHVFGVNEFAARFPNALCGIFSLLFIFHIGKRLGDRVFGWWWVLLYAGSILPHLYFKSGIIDPWFNLFIFAALYFFTRFYWNQEKPVNLWFSGMLIGLATLTKGPVALLIIGLVLVVYWIKKRFRWYVKPISFVWFGLSAIAVTLLWFGLEILQNGTWFVEAFVRYQYRLFSTPDAGHAGFFGYHFVVLLVGCFPASLLAIPSMWQKTKGNNQQVFHNWAAILFWVVLILFSVVQSKIVHYSSLCYFPLTFMAAQTAYRHTHGRRKTARIWVSLIVVLGVLIGLLTAALPWIARRPGLLKQLLAGDPFAVANLEAAVKWTGWESLAGVWLIAIVLIAAAFWYKKPKRALITLCLGVAIFVQLTLFLFVNNIEGYSQRAAIEFFQELEDKDVYVQTVGYKSYAQYFYTKKPPGLPLEASNWQWLAEGPIDKDAYLITKIHKADHLRKYEELEEIGNKNGFVFFRRWAQVTQ